MRKKETGFVNMAETRDANREVMERIKRAGVCPFCLPHLATYHREPVLWQNTDWLVTKNDHPYEGSRHHLLLICRHHLENVLQLDGNGYLALCEAINWVIHRWRIKGGTFFLRFGDMSYNGSSVQHLHVHVIVGERKSRQTTSLKVKVGYRRQRG